MSKKSALPPAIFCRGWFLKGQIEVKQLKESVAGGGGREEGHFEGQLQAEGLCGLVCAELMTQGDVRGSRVCQLFCSEFTFQGLSPSHATSCGSRYRIAHGTGHSNTGLLSVIPAA